MVRAITIAGDQGCGYPDNEAGILGLTRAVAASSFVGTMLAIRACLSGA